MACKVIVPDKWVDEFERFVARLEKATQGKMIRYIDLMESRGPLLPMPFARKLSEDIWELRMRGKQEVRFLYTFNRNQVFIVSWFVKKSQKTPLKELRKAKNRALNI